MGRRTARYSAKTGVQFCGVRHGRDEPASFDGNCEFVSTWRRRMSHCPPGQSTSLLPSAAQGAASSCGPALGAASSHEPAVPSKHNDALLAVPPPQGPPVRGSTLYAALMPKEPPAPQRLHPPNHTNCPPGWADQNPLCTKNGPLVKFFSRPKFAI